MRTRFFAIVLLSLLAFASPAAAQNSNSLIVPGLASTKNGSIVVTIGNTFQQILPAVAAPVVRNSLTIQNNNTNTDNCWIVVGGTLAAATTGKAILLTPAQPYSRYFPLVPNDAIYGTCATTNDTIYLDTQ